MVLQHFRGALFNQTGIFGDAESGGYNKSMVVQEAMEAKRPNERYYFFMA
jgi:hypothetical protein